MRATPLMAAVASIVLVAVPCFADNLELPAGPNRELVYGKCRTCHDLQYLIESAGVPRDTWSDLLDSMTQYGLRIPPDQRAKILDYLDTYLGPTPPPKAATAAPAAPAKVDGATVFNEQCSACHRPNGEGVPGQFPPLVKNPDLFLARDFPARVVLFGLKGKIAVNGHDFEAEMPPLDVLSDAQIAAVVNYVRSAWGNEALTNVPMPPLDAAMVKRLRDTKTSGADAVFAYRAQLKTAAAPK
jgi:mono/diheme cytochrome c family protein